MTGYSLLVACLSLNVYHEARGEIELGKMAVALVTINRAKEENNGDMCATVFKKSQFSWTTDGVDHRGVLTEKGRPKEKQAWEDAKRIAVQALTAHDFTGGATHYHEVSVLPSWRRLFKVAGQWGNHIFYRKEK